MDGRIVKGIAGFYYVIGDDNIEYECKAKGVFRKEKLKPLVGDNVVVDIIDSENLKGNIVDIMPRKNELIRPNVANVDQTLIIFALTSPMPNFVTLDKMILQYMCQNVPVILCFNKEDLADDDYCERVLKDYSDCGCNVLLTSANKNQGIDELFELLKGKSTTVAGPSGVGKSSIVNCLQNGVVMETGDISRKLERGKHTTRHSQIIPLCDNTYIIDTPGFGSFDLFDISYENLADYYEEFRLDEACRFTPCSHTHEPGCAVSQAAKSGAVSKLRYDNYVYIYNELKNKSRRY